MNTHTASLRVKEKMDSSRMIDLYQDKDHLHHMIQEIQKMDLRVKKTNEKSHRWLGWLQAMVVEHSEMTLEMMKDINKGS